MAVYMTPYPKTLMLNFSQLKVTFLILWQYNYGFAFQQKNSKSWLYYASDKIAYSIGFNPCQHKAI